MGRVDGKVAIITGAARGQGEAEARLFAHEGASVVVADVLDDAAEAVVHSLGGSAISVHLDVSQEDEWKAIIEQALLHFGRVDVLVNNAGVHRMRMLEEETVEGLNEIFAVNVRGAFLGIRSVIAPMRAVGGGSIVNVSSTAGIISYPAHTAYSISKWALRGLTRTAAIELATDGIRVNCMLPGAVRTEMMKAIDPIDPALPVAAPNELAELALFLASEASSFISGTDVLADGGALLLS